MNKTTLSHAVLLSIGEELLVGDTINTNSAWLGSLLTNAGVRVSEALTIPDDKSAILYALKRYLLPGTLVVSTGGLGPTHDDITKITLLDFFNVGLKRDDISLERNRTYFESRGIPFSASNYGQSDVPENADVLQNLSGTAQGIWIEHEGAVLVVLPGVPREMKHLMEAQVMPKLKQNGFISGATSIFYLKTMGIGESTLSDVVLDGLPAFLTDSRVSMAFLPQSMGVKLRVMARASSKAEADSLCQPLVTFIRERAAQFIYSEDPAEESAAALGRLLAEKSMTIGFAESCTGGLFSTWNTDVPGSSAWFKGAVVAYSNEVKESMLGVSGSILNTFGAVSAQAAAAMARGLRSRIGCSIAVSATGIAGPDGGTAEKPVGLVWIGISTAEKTVVFKALFGRDRTTNRERTVLLATEVVRRMISGISEMPFGIVLESID